MESEKQKAMRASIRSIQSDTSLTPQQRARYIQQVMMGTYNPNAVAEEQKAKESIVLDVAVTYHDEPGKVFGCKHYIKNCKIKAVCCGQLYTCRRCHDEVVTDHKINRYLIEEMMCFFCSTVQKVSNECIACHQTMAHYFCAFCKFFDGNPAKHIWHCEQCGLCRVGQPNAFEHCQTCHTCMPIGHADHMDRVLDCNCPICGENLFHSTEYSQFPEPCRHAIHGRCFKEYLKKGNYSCPICSKTYSDLDLSDHWAEITAAIEANPVPEEYKTWTVEILCNDCVVKEIRPFHFFGHKCTKCGGYNTNIVNTYRPEPGSTTEEPSSTQDTTEDGNDDEMQPEGQ